MTRLGLAGSISVLLLASASPGLAAGEDTADAVLRECGERSLPRDLVSTCLERARLVNEQAPSSALRDLQARLEQRARTEPGSDLMPPPGQRDDRVYSQPLPQSGATGGATSGATGAPAPLGQYAPPPRDQGPPPLANGPGNGPANGYDDEDDDGYGDDRAGPPPPPPNDAQPYDARPYDNGQQQAAPYDDSDEPPIEGEDDGYDNSLPDPGYDTPDAPDPDWPPPGGSYDDGTDF